MADSEDEELRQPAEEHQMQRGPDEMEGVTAMLPKLKFLESCTLDTDVAKEVALMAGFKLAVGPRVAFEFYNTIETRDLDEMVSKSADSAALMSTFQKNSSHKCKELVLVVKGPGNVITVPDILNGSKIPLRMPTRSQGVTAGTFTSGGIIEVGKSFRVPSIPSGSVFKYFAAKLTTMIIRCRYPLAQSQNGEYKTFSKSSLSVIHVGATGSGMTVRQPARSGVSTILLKRFQLTTSETCRRCCTTTGTVLVGSLPRDGPFLIRSLNRLSWVITL